MSSKSTQRQRFQTKKKLIGANGMGGKFDVNKTANKAYWLLSDGDGTNEYRRFYGITPGNLQDWAQAWGTFFYYTVLLLLGTASWVWASGFIFAAFPITDPSNMATRAFAMAVLHSLLIITPIGEQVTAAINPWVATLVEVSHNLFDKDPNGSFLNLLRIPWYFLISFIGSVLGNLGLAMWPNYGGFYTSDCALDKIIACDALPFLNGVNSGPSFGAMIIGTLLECVVFIVPVWIIHYSTRLSETTDHARIQKRRAYIKMCACLALPIYFIIHVIITPFVGNAFSLWNWLWLAILTNDFSNASVYTWPPLVAMFIAFFAILLYERFRMAMSKI